MRLRTLRAAVAATALVFASTAPALAQYGGSDNRVVVRLTFQSAFDAPVDIEHSFECDISALLPFSTLRIILVRDVAAGFSGAVKSLSERVPLGTFQADANGAVKADIVIPEALDAGNYTLEALGTDPAGKPLVLRQAVVLAESASTPSSLSLTGSDARGIAAVGGVLLVMGASATVATRRRLSAQD